MFNDVKFVRQPRGLFAGWVILLASLSAVSNLKAQETLAGRTFLSIGGGMTFGPGELWSLRRQPVLNPNIRTAAGAQPFVDSLFIGQSVDAGSSFLISVTKFFSSRFSYGADLSYAGLRASVNCTVTFDSADDPRNGTNADAVSSPNRSACDDVRSKKRDAITFDLMPFLAWRMLPNAEITPVFKAGAGLSLGPCTVRVRSALRELVEAPCSASQRPSFAGSIGLYRQADLESQFHFEFRFNVHRWDVLDGVPDLNGISASKTSWKSNLGFSMGVDFQV